MSFSIMLNPWTFRNQVTDITEDGNPNEDAYLQCGAACISMVLQWETGIKRSVDRIKDEILGQNATGIISNTQIISYLVGNGVQATTLPPVRFTSPINATGSLLYDEWDYLVKGHPCITLMYWDYPGSSVLHWRTVIGCKEDWTGKFVYTADPIDGRLKTETYQQHLDMYAGLIIGVGTPKYPIN
jgi:hypothetical protein